MSEDLTRRIERLQETEKVAKEFMTNLRTAFSASGLCISESQVDNEVDHFVECLITSLAVLPKGGDADEQD